MESAQNTFGPYFLGQTLGTRNGCELTLATLFVPTGHPRSVVLRQTRPYADGANEVFLNRARQYAVLHHPNIVPVVDLGTIDGRSYVATQYVRGKNLLRVLARCGQKRLGFPTDVALYIVSKILDALEHAHQVESRAGALRILHADVCHSNILLTGRGEVLLSDFQMATGSTRRRTRRGINRGGGKGYSAYVSPEQVRGEPLDVQTDIFSLGVVLYELVTGHLLFNSAVEAAILDALRRESFEVPLQEFRPDLHPSLARIVRTALSPRPEDRFESASAFKVAIDDLLQEVGASLRPLFLANFMETLFGKEIAEMEGVA